MPELRDPIGLVRHVAASGDIPLLVLLAQRLSPRAVAGPGTQALAALILALKLEPVGADDGQDG